MREIRQSGLAGGEADSIGLPYPDNDKEVPEKGIPRPKSSIAIDERNPPH